LALFRIRKIIEAAKAIAANRDSIFNLHNAADSLKNTLEKMKTLDVNGQLADVNGQLAAFQTQLQAMQRTATDDRASESVTAVETDSPQRKDWEEIKKIWTEVRDKLDDLVNRADGRRYRAMTRFDYDKIIGKLLEDGLVNQLMAEDAKQMNDSYLSFRNQRLPITDEVKADFAKRKARFDAELERYVPSPSREKATSSPEKRAETKRSAFQIETAMPLAQQARQPGASEGLNGNGRLPH
jgi:hypothetical protein